jgi:hypothetical protein
MALGCLRNNAAGGKELPGQWMGAAASANGAAHGRPRSFTIEAIRRTCVMKRTPDAASQIIEAGVVTMPIDAGMGTETLKNDGIFARPAASLFRQAVR